MVRSQARLYGSGRAAIVDVIRFLRKRHGIQHVILPNWICAELVEPLSKESGLTLSFFEVGADLAPKSSDPHFRAGADMSRSVLVIVDYFSSTRGLILEEMASKFSGWTIFDCVHGWPTQPLCVDSWSDKWWVVAGGRKLFWKYSGVAVFGKLASHLPSVPALIGRASPGFPRNVSLAPRWGYLGGLLKVIFNWNLCDEVASSWVSRPNPGGDVIGNFVSPVCLGKSDSPRPISSWPDLWAGLTPDLRASAESLKEANIVCWNN